MKKLNLRRLCVIGYLLIISFYPLAATDLTKKPIAILAYDDMDKLDQELQLVKYFKSSVLKMPVRLSCLSSMADTAQRKIAFAIDNTPSTEKKVWYAVSRFRDLLRVIHNVSEALGYKNGSHTIFYIKNIKHLSFDAEQEVKIEGCSKWATRKLSANNALSQKLPNKKLCEIVQWAQEKKFDAVVWMSCASTNETEKELAHKLISDPILLKNTQAYILYLAHVPETSFEKAIVTGVDSLKSYLIKLSGTSVTSVESLSLLSAQLMSLSLC